MNNNGVIQLFPVEAKAQHVKHRMAIRVRKTRANSISNLRLNIQLVEEPEKLIADCKGLFDRWPGEGPGTTVEEAGGQRAVAAGEDLDAAEAVERAVCLCNGVLWLGVGGCQ